MQIIFKYVLAALYFPFMFFEKVYWKLWREYEKLKFSSIGNNVYIGKHCSFTNHSINIGDDVYIGPGCRFQSTMSTIEIGNKVMFGPNVSIHGGDHRFDIIGRYMFDIKENEKLPKNDAPVIIENDVWIGANVTILKGCHIGEGAIIGAGTIINTNVAPYSIIVGAKPRKIYKRWSDADIKKHKESLTQ